MTYIDHLLTTPYAWITLAGVFVGAAGSRATTSIRRANNTRTARSAKWAAVYVSLAFAVVAATLAVFVPEAERIKDVGVAYQFAGATVAAGLAFRFKLVAGVPVFLLIVAAVPATVLVRQTWSAYDPPQTVAAVRVLSIDERNATVEFIPGVDIEANVDDALIFDVPGRLLGVQASTLSLSPHLFFTGLRHGYRLEEIVGDDNTGHEIVGSDGTEARVSAWIDANQNRLPGVDVRDTRSELVRAAVLRTYEIRFASPSSLEFQAAAD